MNGMDACVRVAGFAALGIVLLACGGDDEGGAEAGPGGNGGSPTYGTGGSLGAGGTPSTEGPWCGQIGDGCNCIVGHESNGVGCGPPLYADVYCCADPLWPNDGSCYCKPNGSLGCYQKEYICSCSNLAPEPGDQAVNVCTGNYCCQHDTLDLCICSEYSDCDADYSPVAQCTPDSITSTDVCKNDTVPAASCAPGTFEGNADPPGGTGGSPSGGGGCDPSVCSGCDTVCDYGFCVTCCYSCSGDSCSQDCTST